MRGSGAIGCGFRQIADLTDLSSHPEQTAPTPVPAPPPAPSVIGSVPLHQWERDALKLYFPLPGTPRGVTRLLNTYRLVRAGIPEQDWTSFERSAEGAGEHRVAMLLLAAAAGHPALARGWLNTLRNSEADARFPKEIKSGDPWDRFKQGYDKVFEGSSDTTTPEMYAKWLDCIERFAF